MLKFNYEKLKELGYEVTDTGRAMFVNGGEHSRPVFNSETIKLIYADLQETSLTANEAETGVHEFISQIEAQHIYNLATQVTFDR